jgi:hypothetical protein
LNDSLYFIYVSRKYNNNDGDDNNGDDYDDDDGDGGDDDDDDDDNDDNDVAYENITLVVLQYQCFQSILVPID